MIESVPPANQLNENGEVPPAGFASIEPEAAPQLVFEELNETVNQKVKFELFKNKRAEYNDATEELLNKLGEQGWELVALNPVNGGGYIFKRELKA